MKEISLRTNERDNMSCCSPVSDSQIRYPTFTYDGPVELDLPEVGTMTIHFHRTSSICREINGKHSYSCTVEVHTVSNVKEDKDVVPPSKSYDEAGDALDRLAQEYSEKEEEDEDEDEDETEEGED